MISQELKSKLSKIYALVKRGGSEGEKAAAQVALDKILSKYNLEGIDLDSLDKELYMLKYKTDLDQWLLKRILYILIEDTEALNTAKRRNQGVKEIHLHLRYMDYITVESSYEYFRRHMKTQWDKFCAPELAKCRKAKTKTKRREELKPPFFSRYCIESNLYKPEEIERVDSTSKRYQALSKLNDIEGGSYKTQLTSGLLLEN